MKKNIMTIHLKYRSHYSPLQEVRTIVLEVISHINLSSALCLIFTMVGD